MSKKVYQVTQYAIEGMKDRAMADRVYTLNKQPTYFYRTLNGEKYDTTY
jgi:hypothetical protein